MHIFKFPLMEILSDANKLSHDSHANLCHKSSCHGSYYKSKLLYIHNVNYGSLSAPGTSS